MNTSYDEKNEILNLFLEEFREKDKLIEDYRYRPLEFLAKRGSYYPPKLAEMFSDIYNLKVTNAIWKGPRSGGKTYGLGDLAASMFLFKGFDVLISSGGEGQAREVYGEVMNALEDKEVADYVPTSTMQITKGREGNWIRFTPASTKRVRGPHPGRGHGGMIILDEEGEMEEKIVKAVLGTGGTADPLVIIRASTAHNIDGTYAELLDKYKERGYTLYEWDAFDVCEKCELKCKDCIPEFREDYCKGKAHKNSVLGWISLQYLFRMWAQETKEWFEVEMMAMRPSGAVNVINREDFKVAVVPEVSFKKGAPGAFGVDWGFKGMAAVLATQMVAEKLRVFDRMAFTRKGTEDIVTALKDWRKMYDINEVYGDSSHPFENDALRKADFTVHEVTFVSFKEAGAGAVKWFFEKEKIEIPEIFKDVIDQLKKWRRGKDGKIIKKEDHFPDALLCTMKKWWEKAKRKVGYLKITKR
ncbi:hypothetical protein ES705_21974 [subsurface metagenome]